MADRNTPSLRSCRRFLQSHYVFAYLSLSFFHVLSEVAGGLAYTALVIGMLLALTISVVRIRRGDSFLMGSSVTLVTLNLLNKISRFNEWELAAGIILATGAEALALSGLRVNTSAAHVEDEPLR